MIPRVHWRNRLSEATSPFLKGKNERPIRIIFHSSSFTAATQQERQVIDLLRELTNLPEINALDTEPGSLPHLQIGTYEEGASTIPITVIDGEPRRWSVILAPSQWLEYASRLAKQNERNSHADQSIFQDVLVARACYHLGYDVLITMSPHLLTNRHEWYLRDANPRTPIEAAKIIGLLLRSRDNYVFQASPIASRSFDRGLFYWVLTRHMLPNMWRYFSACVHAGLVRHDSDEEEDDTLYLGESVLVRCVRALEARDAIGEQFFNLQNDNTRDIMMYHFDYLTLLLSGAFDAQARIARRSYRITHPGERQAGFRRADFKEALKKSAATELSNLVSQPYFSSVLGLLHELRNSIHGAGLPTVGYGIVSGQEESFVEVLPRYRDKIRKHARQCGPPERWGLVETDKDKLLFEPYTYAVTLVNECLKQIDAIADATDVIGLFPTGYTLPELRDNAPDNDIFAEWIRERLAILGGGKSQPK